MNDISRKIVDQIEAGKMQDAKDSINDGIKAKAGEVVDMKRVEMQIDWMETSHEEDVSTDND